jgi:LysR family glycine cleavage system transcriptional activator
VPRLDRFRDAHPGFDIRIDATDALTDFASDGVDVALRYGQGDYPGLLSECLMGETVIPVCSPALKAGSRPLETPADLVHHTLLHVFWKMADDKAPRWRMWLKAAGVTNSIPSAACASMSTASPSRQPSPARAWRSPMAP